MEESILIHRFAKNEEEEIRVSLREYKNRRYIDLRLWFIPSNETEFYPTKKGLTVGLEHAAELKKGLELAQKAGKESTLQQPANSIQ